MISLHKKFYLSDVDLNQMKLKDLFMSGAMMLSVTDTLTARSLMKMFQKWGIEKFSTGYRLGGNINYLATYGNKIGYFLDKNGTLRCTEIRHRRGYNSGMSQPTYVEKVVMNFHITMATRTKEIDLNDRGSYYIMNTWGMLLYRPLVERKAIKL